MTTTTRPLRPFGVALLSIVLMIGGALDVIGGLLLFIDRDDREVVKRMGSADEVAAWAIMAVSIGVVVIVVAAALRSGSNFARYLIAFLAIIRVIGLLYAVISFAKGDWYDALVPATVYTLVAGYLLFDKDSQAFFERPIEPPT